MYKERSLLKDKKGEQKELNEFLFFDHEEIASFEMKRLIKEYNECDLIQADLC